MANLIITIISIALIAVAALMGAYYGGAAFSDGQAKAKAAAILEQAKQISAAWHQWSLNNGGVYNPGTAAVTAYCNGTRPNFLIPAYLSDDPVTTTFGTDNNYRKWFFTDWPVGSSGVNCMPASNNPSALRLNLLYNETTSKICLHFNQIIHGPNATVLKSPSIGAAPGYCNYNDVNTNNVEDTGDYYNFVYKTF